VQEGRTATLLVDGEGTVLMASRGAARIFGARPEDLEGLRLSELLAAPHPAEIAAGLVRLRRGGVAGGSLRIHGAVRERGGSLAPIAMHLSLSAADPGDRAGLSPLTVLVTIHPPAASGPVPAVRPWTGLDDADPDPVALIRRGVILEASEGLLRMAGLPSGSLTGWPIGNLVAAEDLLPVVASLRSVEEGTERAMSFGFRLMRAGGREPIEVDASARRVVRDSRAAVALVLRDVSAQVRTARRALEALDRLESALTEADETVRGAEEVRASRDELKRLHDEVRLANEGLERRLEESRRLGLNLRSLSEMKSRLMANVSHELQTPLVSIKGFTEMLLSRRLGEITGEQQEGLEVALRNINRLIGMIDGLLALARGEEGASRDLALAGVRLSGLVDEAVRLLEPDARRRSIRIRSEVPDDLVVRVDRDKMMQVFVNLLSNAIKYNRDGGDVAIAASVRHGDAARVSISDTGIGMTREQKERIFDRFYRSHEAAAGAPGTGLGLPIAREILARHGALLRVESREGKGSTFSFALALDPEGATPPDRRVEVAGDQLLED